MDSRIVADVIATVLVLTQCYVCATCVLDRYYAIVLHQEGQDLTRAIKNRYTQGAMVNPLTKKYANTICHMCGMRFYLTSENSKQFTHMQLWPFHLPYYGITPATGIQSHSGFNIWHNGYSISHTLQQSSTI